jgi:UDP-N-acetylmuramoyl-tripeptide--D-alanyl-D-alanine ligase
MINLSAAAIRIIVCAAIFPWLAAIYFRTKFLLNILQLEGYQNKRYLKWMLTHQNKLGSPDELAVCLLLAAIAGTSYYYARPAAFYIFLVLWLGGQVYLVYKRYKVPAKKPLVFTPRAARLMIFFGLVLGCQLIVVLYLLFKPYPPIPYFVAREIQSGMRTFLSLILLMLVTPINILIANLLATPLETFINWEYFKAAQNKVRQFSALKVIAVTGSYGKTSTKYIINGLLSPYCHTLMTPESYNTPMGISKVINGQLTGEHEYFIVEMGARKSGDIKELCSLVPPQLGVITSIGPQHLETFGTLDNIIQTKSELIAGLEPEGLVALNYDDPNCRRIAEEIQIPHRSYGITSSEKLDLRAEEISVSNQGVTFTVSTARGEKIKLSSCLLGEHNVYNILAAATIALECGLSLSQVAQALKRVEPVPHRLQLIRGGGGITIIDDAYNSNPKGAQEALRVLKGMPADKKILITPGMVELGAEEYEHNKRFGQAAAGACDIVILVGEKRTQPIAEGLKEAGFPANKLVVVASLAEATTALGKLARPGDMVLFENDLPDNYNE